MDEQHWHILIVDDFADNRELYAYFLSAHGFRVTQAQDGEEGVEKAEQLVPDLIVMDLSLPGIDGWEAARRLGASETTRHIPVVILTAYDVPGTGPPGCEGFLTKPCLPDKMISKITEILERRNLPNTNASLPS